MFGSKSPFDKYLEKATSQLLLEPDWDSILQINDCIRQGDVQPKYALSSIKRKIGSENPHVSLFALQVLESCMKNCGSSIHGEVATKEFMEFLKQLVPVRGDPVKGKILELIQVWSHAFRNEPSYKVVQDTFNLMKLEGYTFPALKEADAMFSSEKAPEWKDSDCCSRCRVQFGMVQRKHHCRACGDVVCAKCSSKNSIIPKFGIEREVRVCDSCYEKINKGQLTGKNDEESLPPEYLASPLSKQSQLPVKKTEQEIQEEEELQLALALSQSEEETKAKERERMRSNYSLYGGSKEVRSSSPKAVMPQQNNVTVSAPMVDTADMDPELARYLNRNYWQQRSEDVKATPAVTQPSAPVAISEAKVTTNTAKIQEAFQNGETEEDPDQFLNALNSSVEIFVNRMRSNSQRGRSIATDSSVQSLFNVISNMHPQLMKYIQGQEDLRAHYESLQDKLAQLRDAREALDALREDHREKRRREMEELERQRQIQMAHKLEIMRQKKHEYLEMQRQLALQRLQEQEREMQMRFEQQRQLTQMRQMQNYGYNQPPYPQGPLPGAPGGFNPATGQMEGSPVHQLQQQPPGSYMGNQPMYGGPAGAQGQYVQQSTVPGQQPVFQQMPPGGPQGQQQYIPEGQMGYNRPDGMQPQGGGYQPQGGMGYIPPASGAPQSMPPQNIPSHMPQGQGYSSVPPGVQDQQYQGSFNMQGMASSLPNPEGQGGGYTQQQYMGGPAQGAQYQQGAPQGAPQGVPQQQGQPPPPVQGQPQNMGPPPGQPPPHQPGPNEAELISFD